jgi:hypothetical protein
MRVSLCDPTTVRQCENPSHYGNTGPDAHTSINCYVRYMDLGFEPGESFAELDEWAKD